MNNTSASDLPTKDDEAQGSLRSVLIAVACVGLVETGVAAFWFGRVAVFSVGFGAFLGFTNLLLLGRMVRAFTSPRGVSMPWIVAAILKLCVLLLAIYLPAQAGVLVILPFVFGFAALPVGIVVSQFLSEPSSSKAN